MFSRLNLIVYLNNHCIHNASCENRDPCIFPGQIWHQLTFPGGGVNRSLYMQGLRNRGACVIKSCCSNMCLSHF